MATPKRLESTPDSVDVHVGLQLRDLRRQQGLSQQALGVAIGVTFQQVQKYERGANRMSASALFRASLALRVDVEVFFSGLMPEARDRERLDQRGVLTDLRTEPKLMDDARLLRQLSPKARLKVRTMAERLANSAT